MPPTRRSPVDAGSDDSTCNRRSPRRPVTRSASRVGLALYRCGGGLHPGTPYIVRIPTRARTCYALVVVQAVSELFVRGHGRHLGFGGKSFRTRGLHRLRSCLLSTVRSSSFFSSCPLALP